MTFTATPLDGSSTPIPMSSAVPDGTNTPLAVEGGPAKSTGGNSVAPVAVYQYDGYDVSQGLKADAAATDSTSSWTVIAMLKGLYAKLAGTLTVSGAVTTSGTVTEANSATIQSNTSTSATQNTTSATRLTSILTALQGILGIQQTDLTATGTISAAQATLGTPVSNATVSITLGQGQSGWEAQLIPGGGGFTAASTIVVDASVDGGTTWFTSSFKVAGGVSTTTVQSVVGTAANIKLSGNAGAKSQVRIRCSVLNAGESTIVTIRSGAGVTDIGLLSAIPAGSNKIGGVTAASGDFADGAIVTIGANADAAVTGDNTGTVSAKLRGFNKMLFDMWDSTNHWLQVKVMNGNPNGQATMANSAPVAPASDYIGPIKPNNLNIAGAAAGTVNAINTDLFAWTDMSGYSDFSVQLTGTWSMTLTIQFSNDQTNPVSGVADAINSVNQNTASTIITANGIYSGRIRARYLRIRATSWTSNASAVGTMWLSSIPIANQPIMAITAQPGNTVNTSPWLFNGANNNAVVAAAAGSVTVVKAAAGVLACVVITTAGTVATNIFDNASAASGTVLLALPATTTLGQIFLLPGTAKNGITAAGSGAGAPGYTVYYS